MGIYRGQRPLLDLYPGAAAAYSLRKLRSGVGAVVNVRRSVDNENRDFTAKQIQNGELVEWVGAGNDGFVTTWYDQSGQNNHATQDTQAAQPKIVSAGALVTENGKPSLRFGTSQLNVVDSKTTFKFLHDGTYYSSFSTVTYSPTLNSSTGAIFNLYATNPTTNGFQRGVCFRYDNRVASHGRVNMSVAFVSRGSAIYSVNRNLSNDLTPQQQYLHSIFINPTVTPSERYKYYLNNVAGSAVNASSGGITSADASNDLSIGNTSSTVGALLSELIIYPSNQSSNRIDIETNINNHFNIY